MASLNSVGAPIEFAVEKARPVKQEEKKEELKVITMVT